MNRRNYLFVFALSIMLDSRCLQGQQVVARPTLALMNFTNAAMVNHADYDPLEWSVPELISTRLSRNPEIDVVDRRRLQQLLDEQDLNASARVGDQAAVRVGRLLGARYMVFGTVLIDRRNRLRIDARVLDVESSKIVHSETFRDVDWNEDVSYAIDSLAERLNRNLRLPGRIVPARPRDSSQVTAPSRAETTFNGAGSDSARKADSASSVPARSRSAGLVTFGAALRRMTKATEDRQSTISMLRTAAAETPSIARDVNEIVRRLNESPRP